jgi:hypothetical protein
MQAQLKNCITIHYLEISTFFLLLVKYCGISLSKKLTIGGVHKISKNIWKYNQAALAIPEFDTRIFDYLRNVFSATNLLLEGFHLVIYGFSSRFRGPTFKRCLGPPLVLRRLCFRQLYAAQEHFYLH